MAEYERPGHMRAGHLFDNTALRRDLWLLALIFLADRPLSVLTQDEFFADGHAQPLLGLWSDFQTDEISRILLSASVALRAIDDRDGAELNLVGPCGSLETDLGTGAQEPLSLREACNKIIHAERLNFDVERLDGGDVRILGLSPTYIRPNLFFYGSHRRRPWRCSLDVIAFVRAAAGVI